MARGLVKLLAPLLMLQGCEGSGRSGLIRSESVAVRVAADGAAEGDVQAEAELFDREHALRLHHAPSSPTAALKVDATQEPDYIATARKWATIAAARTRYSQDAARKWFGSSVNMSATARFMTVSAALPRFLSPTVLSLWEVSAGLNSPELARCDKKRAEAAGNLTGYNAVSRVAFVLPQPLVAHEWLTLQKSSAKLNVYLCPTFEKLSTLEKVLTVLHEVLHHLGCYDLAYEGKDLKKLKGEEALLNTNTFLSYVLDVAYYEEEKDVTLKATGQMPSVDCKKLGGKDCKKDNASCWVLATTAGTTCDQYCKAKGYLCRNSAATAGNTNSGNYCARGTTTWCAARAQTQLCLCTEEDLLGTMDVAATGKR